jgi:poly(A) polymerase
MSQAPRDAWDAALDTIEKLRAGGHVALLAGGCVRDRLLGHAPKDYDVVTDATLPRVREIFPRARQVGAKFGVMLVRRFGYDIEVATFRADGPYSDGRHPDSVTFGTDIEDARRRDFTINGLFLDPADGRVIDYVRGRADIAARTIRTIGDPARRFAEDHLRMLRAVRFAARLNFEIEAGTLDGIRRCAAQLATISAERVWGELESILTAPSRARAWGLLISTGLRPFLSPHWPIDAAADAVIEGRLAALRLHPISAGLALAVVLPGRSDVQVRQICRSLRLSNRLLNTVVWLTSSLNRLECECDVDLADLKLLMREDPWPDLLELLRVALVSRGVALDGYAGLCDRVAAIPPDQVAPPPLLTGDDLVRMGLTPGPQTGRILEAVYRAQLGLAICDRAQAERLAKKLMSD